MAGSIRRVIQSARLRAQGKRELRRLPLDEWAEASLEGWLVRFWLLPPDRWAEAVDLRIEEGELRGTTPRSSFNWEKPFPFETQGAEEAVANAEKWADYERRYQVFWSQSANVPSAPVQPLTAGQVDQIVQEADRAFANFEPNLPPSPGFDRAKEIVRAAYDRSGWQGSALDRWVIDLAEEDRIQGEAACRVWREMIDLRKALQGVLAERDVLAGIDAEEALRVTHVRMFQLRSRLERLERTYRQVAEPMFEKYGRPPFEGEMTSSGPGP